MSDLESEQALGRHAQYAWDNFIDKFIAEKRLVLFEAFQEVSITNTEDLLEIKRTLKTLEALEVDVKGVIATGRLASITIEEELEKG